MRLETSLNDLEELILKNKNGVKTAKIEIERLEEIIKNPIHTAPVKIINDDIRFFSKLFVKKSQRKSLTPKKSISANKKPKQVNTSRTLVSRSTSKRKRILSSSRKSNIPQFNKNFKKSVKRENSILRRKEEEKIRERYFSELECEVLRKLTPKKSKLHDLRPEQYKERIKGVIYNNEDNKPKNRTTSKKKRKIQNIFQTEDITKKPRKSNIDYSSKFKVKSFIEIERKLMKKRIKRGGGKSTLSRHTRLEGEEERFGGERRKGSGEKGRKKKM